MIEETNMSNSKFPPKDWVPVEKIVGVLGVPLETAISRMRKAAEGLEGARLQSGWNGGVPYLRGYRRKTDSDRLREQKLAEQTKKQQEERKRVEMADRKRRQAEQEEERRREADALVGSLRRAGYVIVSEGKAKK